MSRHRYHDDDIGLITFAIEHLFLILSVAAAMWVVSAANRDSRDARVKAAIIATVLAAIGWVAEVKQWSLRILAKIFGDSLGDAGLPPFLMVCVSIIAGAAVAAGVASAVPENASDTTDKVVLGFIAAACLALVTMCIGELWIVGG
jgi:drug/metabolite transporter (DMT)-like permease